MMSRNTTTPLIEIARVTRTFPVGGARFTALDDVSLAVAPGELVAIVGKSGSGKSTLVNVVAGIDRPTTGSVLVEGTDLGGLGEGPLASWRGRRVGVVFQFFQLLPTLTVLENVALPMDLCATAPPRAARRRALSLLSLVGIAEQADKLPATLSGGQQQRAAIARALANDPPLLVADEPTGNLDSRTADEVLDLFVRLAAEGKTVLMVTHERDIAERATRVVTLADGRIVGDVTRRSALAREVGHA